MLAGRRQRAHGDSGSGRARPDPLAGASRLVVDGTNLLHAIRRSAEPAPSAAIVGRLRGLIPPAVTIVVVLDGPPDRGLGTSRLASGVTVRHSGREPADALVERLVIERPEGTLVVTDDRQLAAAVRRAGAASIGNAWLVGRLARARLSAPAAGRPLPPTAPLAAAGASAGEHAPGTDDSDSLGRRWRPGRGATRKRGNPRRGHSASGPAPDGPR